MLARRLLLLPCLHVVLVSSDDRMCLIQGKVRVASQGEAREEEPHEPLLKSAEPPAPLHENATAMLQTSTLQAELMVVSPEIFETLCVPAIALGLGAVLQQYPRTQSAGMLVSFFGAQTAMNLYMKQVFSNYKLPSGLKGIPAPFAITAIQQLTSFLVLASGLHLSRCFGYRVNCRPLESRREVGCVLLLALAFVGNIGLNNLSLSILDISVHLIIRTAGALVNLALEFVAQPVLERLTGETAKWPQVSLRDLALTLIGTFFAGMVICSKLQSFSSTSSAWTYYVGIGVCCLSMIASGIELIVVRTLSTHLKMNALEAIMNMSLPASILLLVPVFFFRHTVSWPSAPHMTDWEVVEKVWQTSKLGIALGVLSGLFATLYNVMLYTLSSNFQAHVISMAGNFNKVALMFLSIYLGMELLPHRPWGEVMIAGIAGNGVAFMVMGLLKAQEVKEPDASRPLADKASK
ncbi:erh [Symbiodinium natans]|uniref:Erh protein n=1 Tax=Symbiodinium natans TaxID=878477 RepID=A0A812I6Z0_9DINO|nr:erh [Symbiodinium natans]